MIARASTSEAFSYSNDADSMPTDPNADTVDLAIAVEAAAELNVDGEEREPLVELSSAYHIIVQVGDKFTLAGLSRPPSPHPHVMS